MRARLLHSAKPYAPEQVAIEEERATEIRHPCRARQGREATADLSNEERLLKRVAHLRELVVWAGGFQQELDAKGAPTDENL